MWLGTEYAKQGYKRLPPFVSQEGTLPQFQQWILEASKHFNLKTLSKSRLTECKQSITWKGRLIKIKPSDHSLASWLSQLLNENIYTASTRHTSTEPLLELGANSYPVLPAHCIATRECRPCAEVKKHLQLAKGPKPWST